MNLFKFKGLFDSFGGEKVVEMLKLNKMPKNKNQFIFNLHDSDHWNNVQLRKWAKKAGIEKHLHFHMARHTFATTLVKNGANILTVRDLMGQKDVQKTQIYAHVLDTSKFDAVHAMK